MLNPAHAKERFVLFVRPRDREMEIWTGHRAGVEGAVANYGADAAYPIDQLDAKLREYAIERAHGRTTGSATPAFDARVIRLVVRSARGPQPRLLDAGAHRGPEPAAARSAPAPLAGRARPRSGAPARSAATPTSRRCGFARPGMHEYQVQAAVEFVFRSQGSPRDAYPSIVASGANACILHYVENQRRMEDGDLLLIDAGCEYGYHAADITRTFPVNGRFTAPQRAVYEVVLQAQLAAIAAGKPGVRYEVIHDAARRVIAEGLVELKLVPRSVADTLSMHHYREFFMHGTGHWLGMDVHDVGDYRVRHQSRALEPGMVFTVEPGIYIDPERESVTFHLREYNEDEMWERRLRLGVTAAKKLEDEEKAKAQTVTHPIPKEFRGIGIRIEDDILVTPTGVENLTAGTPKTIEEVERTCAEAPRLPR